MSENAGRLATEFMSLGITTEEANENLRRFLHEARKAMTPVGFFFNGQYYALKPKKKRKRPYWVNGGRRKRR